MEAVLAIVIVCLIFFGSFKLLGFLISKRMIKLDKEFKEKTFIQNYKTKCEDKEIKDEIEKFFNTEFNKKTLPIFLTEHYLFDRHHKSAKKYDLQDIIWAYGRSENTVTKFSRSKIASRSYLILHFENGRKKYLSLRDVFGIKDILEELHKFAPWVIVGYSDGLKREIHKNFDKFVERKKEIYNQLQQKNNDDDMSDMHFIVRDKNGRHWGVSGDKLGEFKKHLNNMDKPKTPEGMQAINEMQDKMLSGMLDAGITKDTVIDICFNDSVCGELKLLLSKFKEIFSIPLYFNIGSLQEDALENQIENINSSYLPFGLTHKECDDIFEKIKSEIRFIRLYSEKDITIRVWVEETASSKCGFYYLMNLLNGCKCKIVKGEFESDNENLLNNCEILTPEKIKEYADLWDNLVKDNTDLRVDIDGGIESVDIDYFDKDILELAGREKITTVKLIAKVLNKHKIADFFIAERIHFLINDNQFKVVGIDKKTNSPYNQIIKKL